MVGERIKMLRTEKGLTMKDMADMLNITISAWNKYEKDEAEPKISNIVKIADYFNVSLDFLLGRTNIRDPQIIDTANIQNDFLKEFEWSSIGDPSQMYFLIENLSASISEFNAHKIRESELQSLLKATSNVVVYFNDLVNLKDKYKVINKEIFKHHRKTISQLIEDIDNMLELMYLDSKSDKDTPK